MQEIVEKHVIEFDKKLISGEQLPKSLILYTVDAEHFVMSVKPLESLEDSALTQTRVSVVSRQNKYSIKLPTKVYNFYKMDESDYTVMVSSKDPVTIIITV